MLDTERVHLGATVELARTEVWTIVDDRSDPDRGLIGVDTPLARALLGAEPGDRVPYKAAGREWVVRVTRIVSSK